MINCPNCNHQNPDGALQCEACYTPLPALASCPNCNASIQADASFCGQCGSDLREAVLTPSTETTAPTQAVFPQTPELENETEPDNEIKTQNFLVPPDGTPSIEETDLGIPDLIEPDPLVLPEPVNQEESPSSTTHSGTELSSTDVSNPVESFAETEPEPPIANEPLANEPEPLTNEPEPLTASNAMELAVEVAAPAQLEPVMASEPEPAAAPTPAPTPPAAIPTPVQAIRPSPATQLQVTSVRLKQVQTNTLIELPRGLSVVRIGKPNDHTPPDIDVSGFPDSEIVSRVHASIRVEGDTYFLEDVGSSNGTYINGLPLPVGNRHRLRPGDRIAFGKGDKVSFIFEISS